MGQSRIQDYGTPVVAKSFKKLAGAFASSAVLDGFRFSVLTASIMKISPGTAITDMGVVISESETKTLPVANSTNAVDYTVYYQHVDADVSGGVPADLIIVPGILTPDVVSGVILGYVQYPGGAVPLNTSFFVQELPLKIGTVLYTPENTDWVLPINNNGFKKTAVSGGTLDLTDVYDDSSTIPQMYLKVRNNALTTGTVTLTFPFKVKDQPFSLFQLVLGTDVNASLTPVFIDSAGTMFTMGIAPYSGTPALTLKSERIPRTSVQTPNTLVFLQLIITAVPSREVKIQSVGISPYNLPT